MDRHHRLDAPDNETLQTVEQVTNRSDLTTLYHPAKQQWDGDIISEAERTRRHEKNLETISFGVRRKAPFIGILAPLPLLAAGVGGTVIVNTVTEKNASILVIPVMFLFFMWVGATFLITRKLSALFYDNALRAGPPIAVLIGFLSLSAPLIYIGTHFLHQGHAIQASLIMSGVELAWSIVLTLSLLVIWTTPRLGGFAKLAIISSGGIVLILANFLVTLPTLF